MRKFFKDLGIEKFEQFFDTDEKCLAFLASEKWQNGFVCRKCGHENYCQGKTPYSRRCTRCKSEESATAHTIFHRCKVPLTKAFKIAYTVCSEPEVSTYELSAQNELRQMTCWKLKKKLMECIEKRGALQVLEEK